MIQKKRFKLLLLLIPIGLFVFSCFGSPAYADTSDFIGEMMPSVTSSVPQVYNQYPIWNYSLDANAGIFDPLTSVVNFLESAVFLTLALLTRLTIMLMQQAFTLDIIGYLASGISDIVNSIKSVVWDPLIETALVIAGLYMAWNAGFAAKRTKSWNQLFVMLMNIGIAITFFAYPSQVLNGFNEVSKEASASIMTGVMPLYQSNIKNINDAVVIPGNSLWNHLVKYPWYYMEFGKISEGQQKESRFLPYAPGSANRKTAVETETTLDFLGGNFLMEPAGVYSARLLFLIITVIYDLIVIAVIIILSLLVVIAQFIPLVLLALAACIMIVSMIPGFGFRIIQKWLERIAGAAFYKVVISIFLSIMLVISEMFYRIFDSLFLVNMIVQIVVTLAIVFERKRIIGMFMGISQGADHVAEVANQKSNYGGQLMEAGLKAANLYTGGALDPRAAAGYGAGALTGTAAASMVMRAGKKFAEVRGKKKVAPYVDNYLNYKYQTEKADAEKRAEESGQPVQYNDFVNSVSANMERGLPLYTPEERDKATNDLYGIRKQGGDIKRVYNPLGVNTKDPAEFAKQASRYQQRVAEKRNKFNEARMQREELIRESELIPKHAVMKEQPVDLSDKARENQQANAEFFRSQRINRNDDDSDPPPPPPNGGGPAGPPPPSMVLDADTQRKREEATKLAQPGVPKEKEGLSEKVRERQQQVADFLRSQKEAAAATAHTPHELTSGLARPRDPAQRDAQLTDRQRASIEQKRTLKAQQGGGSPPPAAAAGSHLVDAAKAAKTSHLAIPRQPKEKPKAYGPSTLGMKTARTPEERQHINDVNAFIKDARAANQRDAQQLANSTPFSSRQPREAENKKPSPKWTPPSQQERELEVRTEAQGQKPAAYVASLKEQRQNAWMDKHSLQLYQQHQQSGSPIPERFKRRAESILDNSGQPLETMITMADQVYQDASHKAEFASTLFDVGSKSFVEVPAPENPAAVKRVEVKSFTEQHQEIMKMPIEEVRLDRKADEALRQSVVNDWNTYQEMYSASPEQYIMALQQSAQQFYAAKEDAYKSIGLSPKEQEPQLRDQAVRFDAIFRDYSMRRDLAKELFGLQQNRSFREGK